MSEKVSERELLNQVRMDWTENGDRLFRNDSGQAWVGRPAYVGNLPSGQEVTLHRARKISYGLHVGSSDLIGWTSIEITPEMVGQQVAVFTAIEAKTRGDKLRANQHRFLIHAASAGGLAYVAYEIDGGYRLARVGSDDDAPEHIR